MTSSALATSGSKIKMNLNTTALSDGFGSLSWPVEETARTGSVTRWHDIAPTQTREVLLMTAIEVLLNRGPSGFSLNAVLRRSGVSKGSFFHHYASLEALLVECHEFLATRLAPTFTHPRPASLEAFLEQLGRDVLASNELNGYYTAIGYLGELARHRPALLSAHQVLLQKDRKVLARELSAYAQGAESEAISNWAGFLSSTLSHVARDWMLCADASSISIWWTQATLVVCSVLAGANSARLNSRAA